MHLYNEMTTVINQTCTEVSLNWAHLQKVEMVVNNVFQQMILMELSLTRTVRKVSTLKEEVIVDWLFVALESVHSLWLWHTDHYRRQRASLELGQLTEEILSPHDSRSILDISYERGIFLPGLAWYCGKFMLWSSESQTGDLLQHKPTFYHWTKGLEGNSWAQHCCFPTVLSTCHFPNHLERIQSFGVLSPTATDG